MIRLGAPLFMTDSYYPPVIKDPYALARAHRGKGYSAAYAPLIPLNDRHLIMETKQAFALENVMLAEVGYWGNLLDTDSALRKENREKMTEALALADALGANCAVALAGSYCSGFVTNEHRAENFTRDAFAEAVDMARYFIDTVKPTHTSFAYEIYQFGVVDSIGAIRRLIRAVDRPQFAVHLDLCNLVNCPRMYFQSAQLAAECAKSFGSKIVAAHAKDLRMKNHSSTVVFEEVPNGTGGLDLAACMAMLYKLPQTVPYMIEHLRSEAEYDNAAAFLRKTAAENHICI